MLTELFKAAQTESTITRLNDDVILFDQHYDTRGRGAGTHSLGIAHTMTPRSTLAATSARCRERRPYSHWCNGSEDQGNINKAQLHTGE